MPVVLTLALVFGAMFFGIAQVTPQSVGSTVEGVVLRADTSAPLADTQITLRYQEPDLPGGVVPPDLSATTNTEGLFRIENVPPGIYLAEARRQGYFGMIFGHIGWADVLEITVPRRPQNLSFSMFPGGSVRGRILDPRGQPAAGISVSLLRRIYGDGGRVLQVTEQEVQTNDRGEYRIPGVSPGNYYLRAIRRTPPYAEPPENSQTLVFFPGTTDPARAESLAVSSGNESAQPDIQLQVLPTVRVFGQVVNTAPAASTGIPTPGFEFDFRTSFFLVPRDPSVPRDISLVPQPNLYKSPTNGQFEIRGVLKGAYDLVARIQIDSLHATEASRVSIDVGDSDLRGIMVMIYPPADVTGHVILEGAASTLLPKIREDYMNLWPVDGHGGSGGSGVDANGDFTFPNIPDGRYRLTPPTTTAVSACLSDIRQGGRSVMEDGVITVDRGKADPVQLHIENGCGGVTGTIVDAEGKPVKDAYVVLVPDGARRRNPALYKRTDSNSAGAFTLPGVSPGTYKLFGWKVSLEGAEQVPEVLLKFESVGRSLTVPLGSSAEVRLQAIP